MAEFSTEAEAYWGLFLCKFGIEYVDDPGTGKKIPTCHRSSFDSAMDDPNFELACDNADAVARRQYRDEAKVIEGLRSRIIEVSNREQPYDIFISYKDTDANGERTLDSVLAQDIYTALTEKDYRVFFSRISLEDKLGTEYEPYIFAALNSAKLMLVVGTDYEYFNAVWVKNEWSRFLALIASGQNKTLIPVFKDVDAYDLPKEFRKLAAQDMGKVGAMQDLLRGVDKLMGRNNKPEMNKEPVKETIVVQQGGEANTAALLDRVFIFLEDGDWQNADKYCEKVLDSDACNAEAYLGKLMAELKCRERADLAKQSEPFDDMEHYKKVMRFGDAALTAELKGFNDKLHAEKKARLEAERKAEEARREKERKAEEARLEAERKAKEERKKQLALAKVRLKACRERIKPAEAMISAGDHHTVGLKADGTVVATKYTGEQKDYYGECKVSGWTDIVAVSAGGNHTVGLKADGTVVAVGSNYHGQCEVSGWTDIVAVSAGDKHTVGLKADGTVVAVGDNLYGKCEVSGWTDIVAVSAGRNHTVGLKADGTVVAVGANYHGKCEVSGCTDIVAVSAGDYNTVGLKADGTVVAVGDNFYGQCEASGWKLFNSLETIERERIEKLNKEKSELQAELSNLRGLFTGKRRKEIEARLAEIDSELKALNK